jgi:hypothetical protein
MKWTKLLLVSLLAVSSTAWAQSLPPLPFMQNPLGPMLDVTDDWQSYQPADDFCITPNVVDPTDQIVALVTPVPVQDNCGAGTYKGHIVTPPLCPGCRRLFFDYSQIPAVNDPAKLLFYAHGHAYFRTSSLNPTYTIDPLSHSPNIKNFTNDKLVAPDGSLQEQIAFALDLHDMSYVGDTKNFAHTASQGPYYIGPTYLTKSGEVKNGAYVDIDVGQYPPLGNPNLDAIYYQAGFNSGEATCPDNGTPFEDGNLFYGGCVDHFGMSSTPLDPYD